MVDDVLAETRGGCDAAPIDDDVRAAGRPLAAFSPHMAATSAPEGLPLQTHVRAWKLNRSTPRRAGSWPTCSACCSPIPNCLPLAWRERAEQAETQARARLVADYIAGMTDRFALDEHKRLFDLYE